MARLDNWQNELSSFIEEKRHVAFDFATWNCMFFVLGGIEAVTGIDYAAAYKGKFKTEKGAARLLRRIDNVANSKEFLEKHFGEAKPIAFARHGDIVLVNPDEAGLQLPTDIELFGVVPGLCYGSVSYFLGEFGLVQVDTLRLGQTIWVS